MDVTDAKITLSVLEATKPLATKRGRPNTPPEQHRVAVRGSLSPAAAVALVRAIATTPKLRDHLAEYQVALAAAFYRAAKEGVG